MSECAGDRTPTSDGAIGHMIRNDAGEPVSMTLWRILSLILSLIPLLFLVLICKQF